MAFQPPGSQLSELRGETTQCSVLNLTAAKVLAKILHTATLKQRKYIYIKKNLQKEVDVSFVPNGEENHWLDLITYLSLQFSIMNFNTY